ncbi:dihydroxy-acid dehydratase [Nesterenkonia pannonica]|uniref:dihydroxy-acid dehydratase domain-containing protein n=1 Tax=Nesterenkonia pannonica TaxID=1548602 RepID=UPI0021642118|nr:dihydroxy-acid dehydratase [Nesterenkonia pannonica]
MGDDDWSKAQIGIASSWNEITPCNLSLDRLAKSSKEGVHAGAASPWSSGRSACPTASRWDTRACTTHWSRAR